MNDVLTTFERWKLDVKAVRERVYRAPTPRERERWHALWLLSRGWSAAEVAEALERDAHTIGAWVEDFRQQGPAGLLRISVQQGVHRAVADAVGGKLKAALDGGPDHGHQAVLGNEPQAPVGRIADGVDVAYAPGLAQVGAARQHAAIQVGLDANDAQPRVPFLEQRVLGNASDARLDVLQRTR